MHALTKYHTYVKIISYVYVCVCMNIHTHTHARVHAEGSDGSEQHAALYSSNRQYRAE